MPRHITLPNELISLVVPYLRHSSLISFSLVCKRFRELALPALWGHLDLGKRDPEQLESLHSELFAESEAFKHFHFQEISLQMLEELAEVDIPDLDLGSEASQVLDKGKDAKAEDKLTDDGEEDAVPELLKRQDWDDRCLAQIYSIEIASFEICLMDNVEAHAFQDVFIPALKRSVQLVSGKTAKMKLYIDCFCTSSAGDNDTTTQDKVSDILACFPRNLLETFSITGAYLNSDFLPAVMSNLRSLSLQSVSGNFPRWKPNGLRKLHISWTDEESVPAIENVQLALQLAVASSSTLEKLSIASIAPLNFSGAYDGNRLHLPALRILKVTDDDSASRATVVSCLDCLDMPRLAVLALETSNISTLDLSDLLRRLPSLRVVKVSGVSALAPPMPLAAISSKLLGKRSASILQDAGITLHIAYTCLRCESPADLLRELSIIRNIALNLVSLNLSCCEAAVGQLEGVRAITLPALKELSFNLTDTNPSLPSGSDQKVSPVRTVLDLLDAPQVIDLQVIVFMRSSSLPIVRDICTILEAGKFPHLENAGGMIIANGGGVAGDMNAEDDRLREVCIKLGVESSGLRILTKNDIGGMTGNADADPEDDEGEWVDEEDEDGAGEWADEEDEVEDIIGHATGQEEHTDAEWDGMVELDDGDLPLFVQDFLTSLTGGFAAAEEICGSPRFEDLDEGHLYEAGEQISRFVELDERSVSSGNSWTSAEELGADRITEL